MKDKTLNYTESNALVDAAIETLLKEGAKGGYPYAYAMGALKGVLATAIRGECNIAIETLKEFAIKEVA